MEGLRLIEERIVREQSERTVRIRRYLDNRLIGRGPMVSSSIVEARVLGVPSWLVATSTR